MFGVGLVGGGAEARNSHSLCIIIILYMYNRFQGAAWCNIEKQGMDPQMRSLSEEMVLPLLASHRSPNRLSMACDIAR